MKKKKDDNKPKDVMELFHHFANRVKTEDKRSNYSYDIKEDIGKLYYHNSLIAVVDYKKKYILHDRFSHRGRWGNGYCNYDLTRAFKNKFISIGTDYSLTSDNFVEHLSSHIFHTFYKTDFEQLIIFKELMWTESSRAIPYSWNIDNKNNLKIINNFARRLGIKKSDIYNFKFRYDKPVIYSTGGWSTTYTRHKLPFSLNDIIKGRFLTKEEKKRLEYIKWRVEIRAYISRDMINISRKYTWLDIYNNPELKAYIDEKLPEFKAKYEERERIKQEIRVKERERLNEERRTKSLDDYNKWLVGWFANMKVVYFYDSYLFPTELKLVNYFSLDSEVHTTRGARVPIGDAKKLYKLFKATIKKGKELRFTRGVGAYTATYIGKSDKGYYITIGCHRIYEEQIDNFIKRFKLDWDD